MARSKRWRGKGYLTFCVFGFSLGADLFQHGDGGEGEDDEGRKALNKIWKEAKNKGYISPANIIMNHNKLANEFFALDVRYDDKHHGAEETIPSSVLYVFGKYTYNYSHFVVLNKNKEVIFDSYGTSNTIKYGKLESMRWYYAV